MTGGLSRRLAEHVAATRFADIPAPAVEAARRSLLDAVGVMLAASGMEPGCDPFIDLARGAPGRCAVLGRGFTAGLLPAAFANGSMAHALDYEDALDGAPIHPNAAAIPAVLALAQDRGGVSGGRLLTAIAVGCDVVGRLGLALDVNPDDRGWYPPPILGAQGAAAASASLLGLTVDQALDAFGLTVGPGAQSAQFKRTPDSTLRAVRDAFATQAGMQAALLARGGVRAFDDPFEGPAGFFALYAGGAYSPGRVLADLGVRFMGEDVAYKPWPSCRGTHAAIEAALALRGQIASTDDIVAIEVEGAALQTMLVEPAEQKQAPRTAIDAKFSLPFTIAAALADGAITLDTFAAERFADVRLVALARRVAFKVRPGASFADTSGALRLTLADGRVLMHEVEHPLGHPTKPMSEAAMRAKFADCAGRARQPVADIEALAEAILSLDRIDDLDDGFLPLLG